MSGVSCNTSWKIDVKSEKFKYHSPSVTFLGYIFVGGQVKTYPVKIQGVSKWPTPTFWKHLQRFLGFDNF